MKDDSDSLGDFFASADVVNIDCPICTSLDRKVMTVGDRHDLGLSFVQCLSCGLVYLSPLPISPWFDTFYADYYWRHYLPESVEELFPVSLRRASQILAAILPEITGRPERCLDVGCGPGGMLTAMASRLPHADIWGVEPSAASRDFCTAKGHSKVLQSLDDLRDRGERFDLITLNHVLEHTVRPLSILSDVRALLSPRGSLYVEVPDVRSSQWSGFGFFHIAHVLNFDETTLRFALTQAGFAVSRTFAGVVSDWPWAIGALAGPATATTAAPPPPGKKPECLEQELASKLLRAPVKPPRSPAAPGQPQTTKGPLAKLRQRFHRPVRVNRQPEPTLQLSIERLQSDVVTLRQELDLLQRNFQLCIASPHNAWLYQNRSERMDVGSPLFPLERRRFHAYRYRFATALVKDARVADIACGTGYGTSMLRKAGAASVVGIDIDPEAIQYAKTVHSGDVIDYRCAAGDVTGLPDGAIDLVVSFETIEHVPDDQSLVEEFARILAPGGRLVVSTPNNWPVDLSPHHVRTYDRPHFEQALSRHFIIEGMYNQNSGGSSPFNHGQAAGIVPTTPANDGLAECLIAVARKPS